MIFDTFRVNAGSQTDLSKWSFPHSQMHKYLVQLELFLQRHFFCFQCLRLLCKTSGGISVFVLHAIRVSLGFSGFFPHSKKHANDKKFMHEWCPITDWRPVQGVLWLLAQRTCENLQIQESDPDKDMKIHERVHLLQHCLCNKKTRQRLRFFILFFFF